MTITVEIRTVPRFHFLLDLDTVDAAMALARTHYDLACKQAGRIGGFLYGWANICTANNAASGDPDWDGPMTCEATPRDLDLFLKICEPTRVAVLSKLITPAQAVALDALCAVILRALDAARPIYKQVIIIPALPVSGAELARVRLTPGRM